MVCFLKTSTVPAMADSAKVVTLGANLTEAQKELLYAISEEHQAIKSITSAAFIKRHRLKSASAVQSAARKLLEYDLLTRREGEYSIADPLMALWLKSRQF